MDTTHIPAPADEPAPDPLLSYGAWQAKYGQASGWEHYTQYLQEFGPALPFGQLPAVFGLPAELVGYTVSRGLADSLLSPVLKAATRWLTDFRPQYPPVAASTLAVACLAYFDQAVEVDYDTRTDLLTPEKLLRGIALALPFWPGLFGITEPEAALAAMRELLTEEDAVSRLPDYSPTSFRQRLVEFAGLVLQYALFGERRFA